MLDLLALQKKFITDHLRPGDTAVDFTMGNGHDTEFLSRVVGAEGCVFAFDIQKSAVDSAAQRLAFCGCPKNYTLILDSHSNMKKYITEPFRAGMFNLGWLPGGDRGITTLRETTLPAVADAISLLAPDGVLTVAVYPGHDEGRLEGEEIMAYLATLPRWKICSTLIRIVNSPSSPFFFVIESK